MGLITLVDLIDTIIAAAIIPLTAIEASRPGVSLLQSSGDDVAEERFAPLACLNSLAARN